jgi:hypothetical protein
MHRQYKLNQQAAQTGPLMTALVRIEGHVRLSPLVSHRSSVVTARQRAGEKESRRAERPLHHEVYRRSKRGS